MTVNDTWDAKAMVHNSQTSRRSGEKALDKKNLTQTPEFDDVKVSNVAFEQLLHNLR